MAEENIFKKFSADQNQSTGRSLFSGAHDYFVKNVLPDDIQTHTRTFKSATPYTNNRDQIFILVRSGSGKMMINGLEYKLCPNTLINLGPFHRYRFIPAKGTPLEITESRINSGAYVYMIANPYINEKHFYVPSEPPVIHLRGLLADIANDSMDGLLDEMPRSAPDKIQICFCYVMDLIGIITEKMPREYFIPPAEEHGHRGSSLKD